MLAISRSFRPALLAALVLCSLLASRAGAVVQVAQQAYLKASSPGEDDRFSRSVAASGEFAVVGAPFEDSDAVGVGGDDSNELAPDSGAAYVFERTGTDWTHSAYLKASNAEAGDLFGQAVAMDGDTIAIGAPEEDSPLSGEAGAVYVFVRLGSTWVQEAYLKASNEGSRDFFGSSLSLDGDTLVVGAPGEDSNATGVGGNQNNGMAFQSGAAYVFVRSATSWSQQAYLKASNTDSEDGFGSSVAVHADTIVVGAPFEDSGATGVDGDGADNGSTSAGAAYVYSRSGSTWTLRAYLKASDTTYQPGCSKEEFGNAVSVWDDTLVVAAHREDGGSRGVNGDDGDNSLCETGAVYVFERVGSTWVQDAYLKASLPAWMTYFGRSVALRGDRIAVGAIGEDSSATGVDGNQLGFGTRVSGAVYLFDRSGTSWSQSHYVKASNSGIADNFGHRVGLSETTLIVSSVAEDSAASGVNGDGSDDSLPGSGAAYLFDLNAPPPPPPTGIDHCSGDGGDQAGCTDCPCGNNIIPGMVAGCLTKPDTAAQLMASGSPSVALPPGSSDDLRFSINGVFTVFLGSGAFCILLSGDNLAPNQPSNPCFGTGSGIQSSLYDGLRCVVGNVRRHGGRQSTDEGTVGVTSPPWGGEGNPSAGIANAGGGFSPGQTRYFQAIFRQFGTFACNGEINTSQAIEITFTP